MTTFFGHTLSGGINYTLQVNTFHEEYGDDINFVIIFFENNNNQKLIQHLKT